MTVQADIELKLSENINALHLTLENESHNHNVPAGSESHFKLVLVSDDFKGLSMVKRHQKIYAILSDEMAEKIHALAIHVYTAEEWQAQHGETPMSPPCLGGGK